MKRLGFFLISLLLCTISIGTASAQTGSKNEIMRAHAGEDRNVKVGREVVFDASHSYVPLGVIPVYKWDMGNGDFRFGLRPIFSYDVPGVYKVKLTIESKDGTSMSVDETVIEVFEEQAVVIARQSDIPETQLHSLIETIKAHNIAVELIYLTDYFPSEFIERRVIKNKIMTIQHILADANMVVGVNRFAIETLLDYNQTFPEDLKNKKIQYLLTSGSHKKTNINMAQFFENITHSQEVSVHYIEDLPSTFFQSNG